MLNKLEISKLLGYLLADSGRPLRDEKVQVWHDQFKNIDHEIAWKAAKHLNAKGFKEWEPRTQEFRDAIGEVTETTKYSGDEAYNLAVQAVKNFGSYREQEALAKLPKRVAIALQRFGYKELCMADESMHGVHRAQFARIFDAVKTRDAFTRSAPELTGNILKSLPTNVQQILERKKVA